MNKREKQEKIDILVEAMEIYDRRKADPEAMAAYNKRKAEEVKAKAKLDNDANCSCLAMIRIILGIYCYATLVYALLS